MHGEVFDIPESVLNEIKKVKTWNQLQEFKRLRGIGSSDVD
jgi:hypothetical protein